VSVPPVTVSQKFCAACGGSLEGRRRQTKTCSDACRQTLHRSRTRETVTPAPTAGLASLTAELRRWLRAEIDRRTRERLAAEGDRLRAEWELVA
jgi:predicted nucleic acid-binding Zn ribbon protein